MSCMRMINGTLILAKLRGKAGELIDMEKKYGVKEMKSIIDKNTQVMMGRTLI